MRSFSIFILIITSWLASYPVAMAQEALQWRHITFPTLAANDFSTSDATVNVISKNSASLFVTQLPADAWNAECIAFEWRVEAPFSPSDLEVKGEDDRPLSLIVWFGDASATPTMFSPIPDGTLLNLTFGGALPIGSHIKSPYHEQSSVWIARNGNSPTGQWIKEHISVRQLAHRFFDKPLGAMKFLAILSDSDDTNTAYNAAVRHIAFDNICAQ